MRAHASCLVMFVFIAGVSPLRAQSIFTFAGGGTDDGRPATVAGLGVPANVSVDFHGNLYITESFENRIRRVSANGAIITTIAGSGARGFSGDGGPAAAATLFRPGGAATDHRGNLFVADTLNDRIRKVSPDGTITTFAGSGERGFLGDNGPALAARLNQPFAVVADRFGNLFVSDAGNHRVRRIDAATGRITTIAGTGTPSYTGDGASATLATLSSPGDLALDPEGNLFVADTGNRRVRKVAFADATITTVAGSGVAAFSGDGGPATGAGMTPRGLAVDARALFIADSDNHRVRRVDLTTSVITTFAGTGISGFSGDGGNAAEAQFANPYGLALHPDGALIVSDGGNQRVRRIDLQTTVIATIAGNGDLFSGDGGLATAAALEFPNGLAVDSAGNLYIADSSLGRVRRVDVSSGIITTVAGTGTPGYSGDGGPATQAQLSAPIGVALDAAGNLYIGDRNSNRLRKVSPAGIITTIAGPKSGFSGDGGPSSEAGISFPSGVASDAAGNVFFADFLNQRVRRIDGRTGVITTVAGSGAGSFGGDGGPATAAGVPMPFGVAVDRDGRNLYITHNDSLSRVRKVDLASGLITTVAGNGVESFAGDGGPATAASLDNPRGLAVDAAGNLFVSDFYNARVRKVAAGTGFISTVAGDGSGGYSGDGGPATAAGLYFALGLTVDARGNLYVADYDGNRVRVVPACVDVEPVMPEFPSAGASGVASTVALSWRGSPKAMSYDVYLDTVNPPQKLLAARATGRSQSAANLQPGTTYYWQVVAKGDPFCPVLSAAPSSIRSFTTAQECSAVSSN